MTPDDESISYTTEQNASEAECKVSKTVLHFFVHYYPTCDHECVQIRELLKCML